VVEVDISRGFRAAEGIVVIVGIGAVIAVVVVEASAPANNM
jgi:hypothetical protein